jgi:hypothetical protein
MQSFSLLFSHALYSQLERMFRRQPTTHKSELALGLVNSVVADFGLQRATTMSFVDEKIYATYDLIVNGHV